MNSFKINQRNIGQGFPVYIVAEISGNHGGTLEQAVRLVQEAKLAGADAVKVQTFTADTITISSKRPEFKIRGGTLWDGQTLHELYELAHMPWEWQPKLQQIAHQIGLDFFSTPFDSSAVDFLDTLDVPAFKIASPELIDLPLIAKAAQTGKPLIFSTGMATLNEISEAIETARQSGAHAIALLKCTSAYPAPLFEMNLSTITDLIHRFKRPVGLSDHSLGIVAPIVATSLGASIIEKHFTLSREGPGTDVAFSLVPSEFRAMTEAVRAAEQSLGLPSYGPTAQEQASLCNRRSLYVVENIKKGAVFTSSSIRSIRPGNGLEPKYLASVIGKSAAVDIESGTPLALDHVEDGGTLQK